MELRVLGSSSRGNCYVLDNGSEALIVECGMPYKDVQRAVDYDISRIAGVLVSHEHGDHAKHAQQFIDARMPVFTSNGTKEAIGLSASTMQAGVVYGIGSFSVLPFNVQHDAAEPFGFLIQHVEMGITLFATDTYYLAYKFKGLNNIMLECNYSTDILNANIATGRVDTRVRSRIVESHCSYDTCMEVLMANDLTAVNNIVLIHLSDNNSNAFQFQNGIKQATGKNVHVAEKGLIINFNKSPF